MVRRIWTRERNGEALTENLSETNKEIILLVLRIISELSNTIDQILSESENLFSAIAAVAVVGTAKQCVDIEARLSDSQVSGPLLDAVRRALAGERDLSKRATGLTVGDISLVRRLLEHVNKLSELADGIVRDSEPLLKAIVAEALGDESQRAETHAAVVQMEQSGIHLSDAVERIWSCERDPDVLIADVGVVDKFLVHRILKLIAQSLLSVQSFLKCPELYLRAIAKIANGDSAQREEIDYLLAESEKEGLEIRDAIHKIWAGERDRAVLTRDLGARDAELVCRILKVLSHSVEWAPKTREEVLASLPSDVRDAWKRRDEAALRYATLFLPVEERDRIRSALRWMMEQENEEVVRAGLPLLERMAAAFGSVGSRKAEELLPALEEMGIRIGDAVHRICAGARDIAALTRGLNEVDTVLVTKLLELIQIMPRVSMIAAVALQDEIHPSEIESPAARSSGRKQRTQGRQCIGSGPGERDSAMLSVGLDAVSGLVVDRILTEIDDTLKYMEPFLQIVAAAATGDETCRDLAETVPEKLPQGADLREAVHKIWAGERNPGLLTEKLNGFHSSLVMRMLDFLRPAAGPE